MNAYKLVPVSLVFLILTVNCTNKQEREESSSKLDFAVNEAFTALEQLNQMNDSTTSGIAQMVNKNYMFLTENLTDTSVIDSMAISISEYRSIKKPLRNFRDNKIALTNLLNTSINQLNDLKDDIENDRIYGKEFEGYYNEEQLRLENVLKEVKREIEIAEMMLRKYERLSPVMDSLVEVTKESMKTEE